MELEDLSKEIEQPSEDIEKVIDRTQNHAADIAVAEGDIFEREDKITDYCALVERKIPEYIDGINRLIESLEVLKAGYGRKYNGKEVRVSVNKRKIFLGVEGRPRIELKLERSHHHVKKIVATSDNYIVAKPAVIYPQVSANTPEEFAKELLKYIVPHLRNNEGSEWYGVPLTLKEAPSLIELAYAETAKKKSGNARIQSEIEKLAENQ